MHTRLLLDVRPAAGPHGQRGIGRYVRGLTAGIALLPDDLVGRVWAMGEPGPTLEAFGVRAVPTRSLPANVQFLSRLCEPFGTSRALSASGAGILHQTDPMRPWSRRGVSSVVTVYDLIPLAEPNVLRAWRADYKAVYRWYLRQVRRAARIVAISSTTASDLQELLGVDGDRIDIVYPVVAPAGDTGRVEPPVPTFLYVGALDVHKQPELAVQALARFRAANGDGRLRIIGPAQPDRIKQIRALAISLGVGPFVSLEGRVPDQDLDRAYASTTAVVFTSRAEGFGLPPVEALARSVPVIAVRTPAATETLEGMATLVPPDPEAIATAMANPMTPPAWAAPTILDRYSARSAAASLGRCYLKVMG